MNFLKTVELTSDSFSDQYSFTFDTDLFWLFHFSSTIKILESDLYGLYNAHTDLPLVFIKYIKSFLPLFSKYSILSFASPSPHYCARPMRFESRGTSEFFSHWNALTEKA